MKIDQLIELLRAIYTLLQNYMETHAEPNALHSHLEEWLDKESVMRYLKIEHTTYYRWVREGKLRPRGNTRQHRYFKSDLQELFERRQRRQRG